MPNARTSRSAMQKIVLFRCMMKETIVAATVGIIIFKNHAYLPVTTPLTNEWSMANTVLNINRNGTKHKRFSKTSIVCLFIYFILLNILSNLYLFVIGSNDFHINIALPIIWSSGNKPQYLESLESKTKSPATK